MDPAFRTALIGPMRPNFLILVPACVLLGVATAVWTGHAINWLHLVLVLIGALASHISVNALNEYHDFKSGLDLHTVATPFSGGTKSLPNNPDKAHVALITGVVSLVVAAAVGVFFLIVRGWALLPLGLLGLLTIVLYTPKITRNPWLCLIAPGLGFGVLMVMGTHFALTGGYSWTAFAASLVPFFLVSDLLLLNQFPDVEPDRRFGRHHLLIALGRKTGIVTYALFLAGAYLTIVVGCVTGALPWAGLIALATVAIAVPTVLGAARFNESIPELVPYLGRNVVINIATPVLLAVGVFVAR